ncbi:uncharacterized protein KY384_002061 [Bacidia gigantensis]|uniref:uncharacterized protein n=1 Tax=Bacidia gigantensis TaxID=2732470 RepID=UPI001D0571D6|nr:uncharacterized protein KY384_002061 [Bacidia gigantensis]KAG8533278.1 hypothetical protein KY384_002061 [Bacidia gigantensis]
MTIKQKPDIELHREPQIDDELDFFTSGMDGTGASSPFVKDEPDDFGFMQNFPSAQPNYNVPLNQQYGQSHTQQSSMSPTALAMQNGAYGQYGMPQQQNMSNSYNLGNSGIGDDELADLELGPSQHPGLIAQNNNIQFFQNQNPGNGRQMNQQYSSTPDGAPIQSPFTHGNFNYGMANMQHSVASPQMRPTGASTFSSSRPSHVAPNMNRQPSDSRSPMTPRTPGVSALHLETSQAGSLPSQPINYNSQHHKRTSGQWDSNPDSLPSHADTPISSPNYAHSHAQISEMIKSGKHASLPAKVDGGAATYGNPQSQEAKKRRRRESHNLVERRRRDNINEKIQELSHLVPQHRLEDEKVRKHMMNNTPLSPSLTATGMSPPQATSLLAGGGRRATSGSISIGIPPEEKDKGPNKGDILNGSVSWTRDLMLALFQKYQQEDDLAERMANMGNPWPFQQSEDEKRLRTELMAAMESNNPSSFFYSRGPGSGLRVPNHTDAAGEPLDPSQMGTISPQSLSPGDHPVQNMHDAEGISGNPQAQLWGQSLKEEDEYIMQMN